MGYFVIKQHREWFSIYCNCIIAFHILPIYFSGWEDYINLNLTRKVHFAAYLTHTMTLNAGDVVKFDHVQLNEGNSYNSSSGAFTCPKSGVYLVTWFFINNNPQPSKTPVWLRLEVNGAMYAFAGLHKYEQHNPAFRSHLVALKQGDKIQIVAHNDNMVVYGDSYRHTGFSALYVSASNSTWTTLLLLWFWSWLQYFSKTILMYYIIWDKIM